MQKAQSRLSLALLFTALVILTFFGTVFISSTIDFLYRDASGLSSVRTVAQIAALLAGAVLFVAACIIAVPVALQPGRWVRKLLYALPVFLLGFTLVGVVSSLLGVGTVGTLFNLQGIGSVTFSAAWLAVAGVVSTLVVVIASARVRLNDTVIRSAVRATTLASVFAVIATAAMLASVAIVSASQPASFGPGGGGPGGQFPGGGRPPAGQNGQPQATAEVPNGGRPGANFAQPESTGEAPNGDVPGSNFAQPEATGEAPNGGGPGGQNPAGQGGFPPPEGGGFPGGPGGSSASVVSRYSIGSGLMALFTIIAVGSAVSALFALRQPITSADRIAISNPSREAGSAVLACIGLAVIVVGVSQLVRVPHDNPPVQTPITWDSEQTRQLVYSTCMDCHSNETSWPWYSYIAPSSWLTVLHVRDGRQQLNLSELDSMPAFQRANVAENMINQLRSGSMPPKDYLILHPDARLSDEQKEQLIQGLEASLSGQ